MRPAEFEERDFEIPLYVQLLSGSFNLATPGQVFEGHFGIDAAMLALDLKLWTLFGYHAIPPGVMLENFRWGFIWRKLKRRRPLPNFSINVMIQAKRPDLLQGRRSYFARYGISGHYWRFFIKTHQQKILEKISHVLGQRALVVYASPAFDTFDDLYTYTFSNSILDNTNFARIRSLSGHNSWNYNAPGCGGVAESEPEQVNEGKFDVLLQKLLAEYRKYTSPKHELSSLFNHIIVASKETYDENSVARFFLKRYEILKDRIASLHNKNKELITQFLGILMFCDSAGISWFPFAPD
jgi:hypothetical protein